MRYLLTILIISAIIGLGLYVKDQPSLATRINQGINKCLDTVGFWPCSIRHQKIVKEKLCSEK